MINNTKKIVVLDRLNSPSIEQAIFILRDENRPSESDAVTEAQRIINSYLTTMPETFNPIKKKKTFNAKFFFAMVAYTMATVLLTVMINARL